MPENKPRVVFIDNGYVYRRAVMAFRQCYSQPATFIWLRMVMGYLKRLNVTLQDTVLIADDYSSWRKKYYQKYKGQRKEQRESLEEPEWWNELFKEYREFIEVIKEAVPWHFLKKWEMEADDWAGATCKYFQDREVILISSDSDFEQLFVYPNVSIFSVINKEFKERKDGYEVLLSKIRKGDKKDNICSKDETEMELENREKVLSLINLPDEVAKPLYWELETLPIQSWNVNKMPYPSIRKELKKLYGN